MDVKNSLTVSNRKANISPIDTLSHKWPRMKSPNENGGGHPKPGINRVIIRKKQITYHWDGFR